MIKNEEYIREFSGKILGIVQTDDNGDQIAIDFPSRKILGYYRAKYDHTTDFFGRIVNKGNTVVTFIYKYKQEHPNS